MCCEQRIGLSWKWEEEGEKKRGLGSHRTTTEHTNLKCAQVRTNAQNCTTTAVQRCLIERGSGTGQLSVLVAFTRAEFGDWRLYLMWLPLSRANLAIDDTESRGSPVSVTLKTGLGGSDRVYSPKHGFLYHDRRDEPAVFRGKSVRHCVNERRLARLSSVSPELVSCGVKENWASGGGEGGGTTVGE